MTPGPRAKRLIKDGAIALSCANLWFLAVWADVLPSSPNYFFLPAAPSAATMVGVVVAVLLTAAVVFACVTLARRSQIWLPLETAIRLTMLVLLLHVANLMRREVPGLSADRLMAGGGIYVGAALGVAVIAGVALARRWRWNLLRAASVVPILLLPFAAYTLGSATLSAVRYSEDAARFVTPPFADPKPPQAGPRVVWHMFDAMDERMTFVERPASVHLPELDRLRATSVVG